MSPIKSLMKGYTNKSVAAILTRPPEVICLLKLPVSSSDVFAIFDSHPRPKHPHGGGLIFSISPSATANYLATLFQVDSNLLNDPELQWQAQLLTNFNAQVYVANEISKELDPYLLDEALLECSLTILSMKLKLEEACRKVSDLESESRRAENRWRSKFEESQRKLSYLKGENRGLENQWRLDVEEAYQKVSELEGEKKQLENRYDQAKAKVRDLKRELRQIGKQPARDFDPPPPTTQHQFSGDSTIKMDLDLELPRIGEQPARNFDTPTTRHQSSGDSTVANRRVPNEKQGGTIENCINTFSHFWSSTTQTPTSASGSGQKKTRHQKTDNRKYKDSNSVEEMDSELLAAILQSQFNAEDHQLLGRLHTLKVPDTFECGICMDEYSIEAQHLVEPCRHRFCRNCIGQHVHTQLKAQRIPIQCPMCTAGNAKGIVGGNPNVQSAPNYRFEINDCSFG
jgi:Ring finger domain